jgi:two-component system sensor histidine kinase QseC
MRSLRTRLFVYLTAGAAVLFTVAGFALTRAIATRLESEFDRGLMARASGLVALTEQERDGIEFDFEPELMPEFGPSTHPEYFELWLADGSLFRRSPSFELDQAAREAALVRTPEPAPAPRFHDLRLPDGRWGRQVRLDFVPRLDREEAPTEPAGVTAPTPAPASAPAVTLIVARERETLDTDVRRFTVGIAIGAVALMLALAGLTQVALRVGLRSLDRLDRQVRALDASSLGMRVAVEAPPREIAAVVDQVNALLGRLEAAFRRERRLSSDIAHELKTPIAELRSLAEVGGRWPEDRAAVRRFFEDARAIALQMERVVVHLLALARYDEGREPVRTTRVRVGDVIEGAWTPLAQEAGLKRLEFRQQVSPALELETDPDKFALMVANLLGNAVAYSPPGTAVVCASEERDGRASIRFSNRTDNLEPEDLPVMFDRFWRKEEARTGGKSVGLGLSLVRAMADLLDMEVVTRLDRDRTFHLTLTGRASRRAPEMRDGGPARPGPGADGGVGHPVVSGRIESCP